MEEKTHVHNYYSETPVPKRLSSFILDHNSNPISDISELTKINLFVGSNNSGKSLLLREILKSGFSEIKPSNSIKQLINQEREQILSKIKAFMKDNDITQMHGYSSKIIDLNVINKIDISFTPAIKTIQDYKALISKSEFNYFYQDLRTFRTTSQPSISQRFSPDKNSEITKLKSDLVEWLNSIEINYTTTTELNKIYTPTMRSLRKFDNPHLLESKSKSEYKFEDNVRIENGQNIYSTISKMTSSFEDTRQKKKDFELFIGQEFFDNQKIELTANPEAKELFIKIGNEKERPIYDIGEGIQMLIILTFPIFYYDHGIYTIEEPEIFLHPGYQHKLMKTFRTHPKSKNFIFFISTHSNHILDTANYLDKINIFSMNKILESTKKASKESYFIINQLHKNNDSILNSLGVRNTSVFLSNCTIWVEGITDMLYLRKQIELFVKNIGINGKYAIAKNFQEGIHYSFILSGGSSIIHYDFSDAPSIKSLKNKVITKNICGKAFVIVDRDGGSQKARKTKFFKELNGRFKVLSVVEIENLLSNEVIEATIKQFPSCSNVEIDKTKFLKPREYKNIRLGTYIDQHLLKDQKKVKKFSKTKNSENSTLNCKLQFCEFATSKMRYENMTDSANRLTKEILDFIISKNQFSKKSKLE